MKKLLIIYYISILSVFILPTAVIAKESVTLYEKSECSFCTQLEESIKSENIEEQIDITRIDTATDEGNTQLSNIADLCGVEGATPLVYYNNYCYVGYSSSISILREIISPSSSTSTPNSTSTSTTTEGQNNTNEESNDLAPQSFSITPLEVVFIIIAPLSFILIVYYILTRLKL